MPAQGGNNVTTIPWPLSIQYQASAIKAAIQKYNVPAQVFIGMYEQETSLGTNVNTSSAAAIGPFQFIPSTATAYGYPQTNSPDLGQFQAQAFAAAKLLSDNFKQYGSWHEALRAYNGSGAAAEAYASAALAFAIPSNWATALGVASGVSPVAGGGVSGAAVGVGGTGTSTNTKPQANFSIGTTNSPHEDFWTAINRLAQERQWYVFSDGETMYLADGADIMQQTPAMTLDRWGDSKRIIDMNFTWDNSAFQYTASRLKKHKHVQHKSTLAKVTSPVECTLKVICDIDEVRAGDVIKLNGCGPGDGNWLVGDATRSIFEVFSQLTLVPAVAALTEQQAAGAGANTGNASASGSGTVISNMISAASTINNQKIPYVWAGGHSSVGIPSIGSPGPGYDGHTKGYDCSGAVAAVLAAGGLWSGSVGGDQEIPAQLLKQGVLVRGAGSGTPECTLYDKPGSHIFMRLNGQYWGTSDGGGTPTSSGGGGGAWLSPGSDSSSPAFAQYHVSQGALSKVIGGNVSTGGVVSGFSNPFPDGWTPSRLDAGYDGTFKNRIVAPFNGTITYATNIGGGAGNWGGWITIRADGDIGQPSKVMYFAEGIAPASGMGPGKRVSAGQTIATAVASPWNGIVGNIEFGLAQDGANGGYLDVLAHATGNPKQMVLDFSAWCQRTLGLPPPSSTDHAGFE